MGLKDRLRRLTRLPGEAEGRTSRPGPVGPVPPGPPQANRPLRIDGQEVRRAEGRFLKRRTTVPLTRFHGDIPLVDVLEVAPEAIASFVTDERLAPLDSRSCVFLDTETTSLSGGTGVVVFLTGIAFLEGDALHVDQYFMRDFDEEVALLSELAAVLKPFRTMVTFFGKNFDRHRLLARLRLHGIPDPFPAAHLDLCHAGRRMWSRALSDFKLRTVEQELLRVQRKGDLPGSEAPEAYFSFLRGEGTALVEQVFEHNRLDVLSLVTLLARLDRAVRAPATAVEWLAVGRGAERKSSHERADVAYREGLSHWTAADGTALRQELLRCRAFALRRLGRAHEALALCEEWAAEDRLSPQPLVEASKLLEHHLRAPGDALARAIEARRRIALLAKAARCDDRNKLERAISHRIVRLQEKCGGPE